MFISLLGILRDLGTNKTSYSHQELLLVNLTQHSWMFCCLVIVFIFLILLKVMIKCFCLIYIFLFFITMSLNVLFLIYFSQ